MDEVKEALEEQGFLCLRNYIPKHIVERAFAEATDYFLDILKQFSGGHAIDEGLAGFDKVAGLPGKVWEKRPATEEVEVAFDPGPLGLEFYPSTKIVGKITPKGQGEIQGVQEGWVFVGAKAGGRLLKGQPLAAFLKTLTCEQCTTVTFQPRWEHWNAQAVTQYWGLSVARGYQGKLGLGKVTDAVNMQNCPAIMAAQLWMRNYIAMLHQCLPEELCWQPDGASFKAGRN